MKKLLRLMLVSIPFLAFSSVSFSKDNNDNVLIKVQSTTPVYLKSDNESVASPASAEGNTVVVDKNATHNTTIYDDNMNPTHKLTWSNTDEHPQLIALSPVDPSKESVKAEVAINPATNRIDVTVQNSSGATPNTVSDATTNMLASETSNKLLK